MKVILAVLAILGLANGHIRGYEKVEITYIAPKNLDDLLQQFIKFIPFDKCLEIVEKYYTNDPDVQAAYEFLSSDEFAILANKVEEMPEYQNFLKYLYDAGLDIYTYRNILRGIFGLPPIDPIPPKRQVRESGIILMVREILGVLPIKEIKEWYINVCAPDPSFQDFLAKIRSQEFKDLVETVHNSPEYIELTDVLRSQGIDVDEIEKVINDFINASYRKRETRSLRSLVDDLKNLIPKNEVIGVLLRYYLTNSDIKGLISYLKGDEFRDFIVGMEEVPKLKEFLAYLYSHDLDVYNTLNQILNLLNLPPVNPKHLSYRHPSTRSGLTEMIKDILALLPLEDIVNWYHTTCEPDPEYQDLLAYMRDPSFMEIIDAAKSYPAFMSIRNKLSDLEINMDKVDAFLHNFFGW